MSLSLRLSDRLHEILRQSSIRTVQQALVELITNSDDAYSSLSSTKRDIFINIERSETHTNVVVVDQAIGMTIDEMRQNLLVVGDYTASLNSRGMMGRGAKDCSFLGDITFTCIKHGKLSSLIIYQNRTADFLISDIDVTPNDRIKYEILQNGCHVCLKTSSFMVPTNEILSKDIKGNIYLRNIVQNPNTIVMLREKSSDFIQRLYFQYSPRTKIISCEYDVPGFNIPARFELYRHSQEMPYSSSKELMEYGILVGSSRGIYECSALYHSGTKTQDYIWNPNIRFLSGVLFCDHIESIAREAISGTLSEQNPFLVLDANRRNGLSVDHPFTKALYSNAYQILEIVISKMQDIRDDQLIDCADGKDVFDSLSELVSSLLPNESVMYTWRTKDDHSNLVNIASSVKNVELDSEFLGLTWEEIQNLTQNRYIETTATDINKSSFSLSFSTDPKIVGPYQLLYLPGKISMKISTSDPSIREYIKVEDNSVSFVNPGKALTSVGNILLDATNNMVLRRKIMAGATSSLDLDGFNEMIFANNSIRSSVGSKIFSRVISSIKSIKSGNHSDTII